MTDTRSTRQKIVSRKAQLWIERNTFDPVYKDLARHILPRSGRFLVSDRNRAKSGAFNKILDSTPTKAARVVAAGMMAGMTSPARPWFRLATPDADLMKYKPVQLWLNDVQNMMRAVFARSNTYRVLHQMYTELCVFGTAAAVIVPDFDNVIHLYGLTVGEYAIACNAKGEVDTIYREFDMPIHALVREFGEENCSESVRQAFKNGKLDQWVTVLHVIEPREVRGNTPLAKDKPFASIYLEVGNNDGSDKLLRESGFDYFPVISPRWEVVGGDIYGNSPAMEALGDIKQLMHDQRITTKAMDYQADPPVQIPVQLKNAVYGLDLLPGGQTFVDQNNPSAGIRSAFEVPLNISYMLNHIQDIRSRINGAFYADLFLMLANDTRSNITATEISERHEEKMLMLGPVLERLQNEMLDPLIDIAFQQCLNAKVNGQSVLPPPPKELQGLDLKVDFISTLAQAQKQVGAGALVGLMNTVGAVGNFSPQSLDKIDFDQIIDVYADLTNQNPTIIRDDDEVEKLRADRAQAQAKAEQMQRMQQMAPAMEQMAGAAKSISEMSEKDKQAMTGSLSGLMGYAPA